jgi:endo-1,3-1,4-beta-glycanase ExoK
MRGRRANRSALWQVMKRVAVASALTIFCAVCACTSQGVEQPPNDMPQVVTAATQIAPPLSSPAPSEVASVDPSVPASTVAAGPAAPALQGPFTLLFRDEFESLDLSRWQLMTHSWDSNIALFSEQSPSVENGQLALRLLAAPEGTVDDQGNAKSFLGAEVRSFDTLTYGRVRARVRFARASAVVSALVTIYTPWPADDWNELDIECLGVDSTRAQFNAQVYTGEPVQAPVTNSVSPTQDPHSEALGFDSSEDFHIYTIEWTPSGASFWVDDVLRHTWTERIELMKLPQNVLLTIWASNNSNWAGDVVAETTDAVSVYDWVELWEYDSARDPAAPAVPVATAPATTEVASGSSTPAVASTVPRMSPSSDSSSTPSASTTSGLLPPVASSEPALGAGGSGVTPVDEPPNAGGAVDAGAPSASADSFSLLFRDDFDTLEPSRWELMTHSWESNLALFSAESVAVSGGQLTLTLLEAPAGTVDDTGASKSFLGAEVRSLQTIEYGRVRARARMTAASSVVSSLVTIYTPWPAADWNELDIEHLGKSPAQVQFNAMVYTGEPPAAPVVLSVAPTQYPNLVDLGFDASSDFHVYTIEWTPAAARFYVDDELRHTWDERVDLLGLPQNVLLTIWASSSPEWAGPVSAGTAGARVTYDWVEVYQYEGVVNEEP